MNIDEAATDVRAAVRARYAAAARDASSARPASCCGPADRFGPGVYGAGEHDGLPERAVLASLGCGNPTAVADLHPGETVLDLGSGGGIDVLLSARRVGPDGKAYGLDELEEMLALARTNQHEAGIENVEWLKGDIEAIPLPAATVDVVISNCVVNLAGDKQRVLREAARVLRPGGRLAITDVIADPAMDEATRADVAAHTGCIAGALTRDEFAAELRAAGLTDLEITETHRVHEHAASAIVRARKPAADCCDADAQSTCCAPAAKAGCCGQPAAGDACGCR